MTAPIKLISSMATRQVLADLIAQFQPAFGQAIETEAVGGIDAARRVRAGESFDLVVLASNVIDDLIADGMLLPQSRVDLVRSGIAVAIPAGSPRLPIDSEAAVRHAVEGARSLAYSTGPSGTHLAQLFDRWGIADSVAARLVRPLPGVPVASLLVEKKVELGFQQASELMNVPGVDVLGPLPPSIQALTTFSAGICATSAEAHTARALLELLASPAAAAAKIRNGMEPV
ncbi:MAG: substrate-binding domain-containing protein [Caldimonas sp.]